MQHNKWMTKKLPALFLALVMTLSLFSVGASAALEGKVAFVVQDAKLVAIDFSEVIIQLKTINSGALRIVDETGFVWSDALFEQYPPCLVRLGSYNENGVFSEDPIPLSANNHTFTLSAVDGKVLFENVITYEFTMEKVLDNLREDTRIQLKEPTIAIAEREGDLVKTLTFDFSSHDATKNELLPKSYDPSKEISLAVNLYGYAGVTFRAVPVSYTEEGLLTVALYNGETQGVPMHGLCITFNKEDRPLPAYIFKFSIPEDMFRFDYTITNAAGEFSYYQTEIENLPLISVITTSIPKFLMRSIDNTKMNARSYDLLTISTVVFFTPFFITRLYKGLQKSLGAYGLDVKEVFRNRTAMRNVFRGLFGLI